MTKQSNVGGSAPLIIVAPHHSSAVPIARYQDVAGETIISNAEMTPYAITDGKPMQAISSRQEVMSKREVSSLLTIGQCKSCNSKLLATAGTVDAIETAGTSVHCPMCSDTHVPVINYTTLANALAAEYAGEDDDAEDEDDTSGDADDSNDTFNDMDDATTMDGTGEEDPNDDQSFYDDDDAGDDDGDDSGEAGEDDDEDQPEQASTRRIRSRLRAVAEDEGDDEDYDASPDDDDSGDDDDGDADDTTMDGDDTGDDDADDDDVAEDSDGMDDDDDEDDEMEQATAALRRTVARMGETAKGKPAFLRTKRTPEGEKSQKFGVPFGKKRTKAKAGTEEDVDWSKNMDTDEHESETMPGTNEEMANAIRRVRVAQARVRHLSETAGTERNVSGHDRPPIRVGKTDEDDLEYDNHDGKKMDEVPMGKNATASLARARHVLVMARLELEVARDRQEQPIAGRPRPNAGIAHMNDAARSRLRAQRGDGVDGNAHVKSTMAKAGMEDDMDEMDIDGMDDGMDPMDGMDPGLVGDGAGYGDTMQPETPGTEDPTPPTGMADDDDELELSSLRTVDWARARVELLATASGKRWVFADDRPVAVLDRSAASATVVATWDQPVMEKAFANACRNGMSIEEAREFGMRPHRYRITGNEVVRNAIHNANLNARRRADREIASHTARLEQSLSTAFLGTLKGSWPDVPNPTRDALVTRLTSVACENPRGLVDSAFAGTVDVLLKGVMAKARELAGKPDVARNEVAHFVAQGSYQARVDVASDLTARLVSGNAKNLGGSAEPIVETASEDRPANPSDRIKNHLQRIAGGRR